MICSNELKRLDSAARKVRDRFHRDEESFEMPGAYDDPWTPRRTRLRFRERHQDPNATDLELSGTPQQFRRDRAFIQGRIQRTLVRLMVARSPACPLLFFLYQMVSNANGRFQAPRKYMRPSTATPKRTVGHGPDCFGCI